MTLNKLCPTFMCSVDANSPEGYYGITHTRKAVLVVTLAVLSNVQNQIQISNLFRLIKAGRGSDDGGVTHVPSALHPHGSAYPPRPTHPQPLPDCRRVREETAAQPGG